MNPPTCGRKTFGCFFFKDCSFGGVPWCKKKKKNAPNFFLIALFFWAPVIFFRLVFFSQCFKHLNDLDFVWYKFCWCRENFFHKFLRGKKTKFLGDLQNNKMKKSGTVSEQLTRVNQTVPQASVGEGRVWHELSIVVAYSGILTCRT